LLNDINENYFMLFKSRIHKNLRSDYISFSIPPPDKSICAVPARLRTAGRSDNTMDTLVSLCVTNKLFLFLWMCDLFRRENWPKEEYICSDLTLILSWRGLRSAVIQTRTSGKRTQHTHTHTHTHTYTHTDTLEGELDNRKERERETFSKTLKLDLEKGICERHRSKLNVNESWTNTEEKLHRGKIESDSHY
jgi:hypothetical protein